MCKLVVLCILLAQYCYIDAAVSTTTQVDLIRNICNHLQANSVYLISRSVSGMAEKLKLVKIAKQLEMFVSANMTQQRLQRTASTCRPLYVVMDAHPGSLETVLLLSDTSLVEVFQVGQHLQVTHAASLTRDGTLRWDQHFLTTSFYERRANLMGTPIRTTVKYEGATGAFIKQQEDGSVLQVGGFFPNLWQQLAARLNFTTQYVIPVNYDQASWGEQLEMVMKGEVDVAVGAFIMTQHLMDHVTFLVPLGRTSVAVFVKAPTSPFSTNWNGYLAPFTNRLWQTFLVVMCLLVLGLAFTCRVGMFIGNSESEQYGIQDSVLCVLGSFCQQGQDRTPRSWPCRLVYFTSYLTAVVVMAAYSATFISFLTVNQVYLPFTTFDELLHSSHYRLGAVTQSIELSFFQNATEPVLKELYNKKMAPYLKNSPAHYLEGFQRLCDVPNYGFVSDSIQHVLLHQQVDCLTVSVPQAAIPASGTFLIYTHSPFRRILNNNLASMKENGELKRLYLNSVPAAATLEDKGDLNPCVRVEEVFPALAFLTASVIVSSLILLSERAIHHVLNVPEPAADLHLHTRSIHLPQCTLYTQTHLISPHKLAIK